MRTNGMATNTWESDNYNYDNSPDTTVARAKAKAQSVDDGITHTVQRDERGTIDYSFYKTKARSLRSESVFSFFKSLTTLFKSHR